MLIDLFKDTSLLVRASRPLNYMRKNRDCEIEEDLSDLLSLRASDPDTAYHLESIQRNMFIADRKYSSIFNNWSDSHSDIEKLGVCKYQLDYTVIISLEDSLSYLLHRLCGADMERIQSIKDYKYISRGILKLNYDIIENYNFNVLSDADPAVAAYMDTLYSSCEAEDEEDRSNEFIAKFIKEIMGMLSAVLEYVVFYYYTHSGNKSLKLRSQSFSSFVLTSDTKVEDTIEIVSEGYQAHTLIVRSFATREYISNVSLEYAM